MLLLHTAGTTKIGEVRRYTVTYTPDQDRILPLPQALYLRIKNTSSLPLRAAYLHGPYTLYVSVKRQEFQPWPSDTPGTEDRDEELRQESDRAEDGSDDGGVPTYDPNLKAGASFYATLPIPRELVEGSLASFRNSAIDSQAPNARRSYEHGGKLSLDGKRHFAPKETERKSVTWIIEVVSQVIFSTTATVGYEVLLARDEKSLSFAYPYGPGNTTRPLNSSAEGATSEVRSSAIKMKFQDTDMLWNTPPFPTWDDQAPPDEKLRDPEEQDDARERRRRSHIKTKPKKVHLVILTHGMHSNTGADMLFMKEAIDEEERKAALVRQEKREKNIAEGKLPQGYVDENEEQVIVRGYRDNACNTERGIKFLGRRLAKYVLHLVNPANHAAPPKHGSNKLQKKKPTHHHPHLGASNELSYQGEEAAGSPFQITSISFIGHSLGGLVQTYAIAYIHAHVPTFFRDIQPVNFCTLASPYLGLSNENPFYVRFALDFGLVGRTGQDLGLSWKTPSAFSAFAGNSGGGKLASDAASKPLLRILPTGPAHEVLKMFRNRTVYSNVVNDGIVPLRTSCLFFLDWKGLGRVEKARRENGNLGGLVEWGVGQLITNHSLTTNGASSPKPPTSPSAPGFSMVSPFSPFSGIMWGRQGNPPAVVDSSSSSTLRQPLVSSATFTEEPSPISSQPPALTPTISNPNPSTSDLTPATIPSSSEVTNLTTPTTGDLELTHPPKPASPSPFASLLTFLRPSASQPSRKQNRILTRSQTSPLTTTPPSPAFSNSPSPPSSPPPKTTLLEAANDLLNPPLPPISFLTNPASRPRTIFHERVYHAADIPPPPTANISVEEKIARAYHKDMAWRKVLVCLQPDAHNNIVVRREFSNAYGWPVVKHLVETHFGLSEAAMTRDEEEGAEERVVLEADEEAAEEAAAQGGEQQSVASTWADDTWQVTDDESDELMRENRRRRELTAVSRVSVEQERGWGLGLRTGETPLTSPRRRSSSGEGGGRQRSEAVRMLEDVRRRSRSAAPQVGSV